MGNSSSSTVVVDGRALRIKALLSGSGGSAASSTSVYLAEDEARRKFAVKVHRVPKDDAAANAQATRELKEHARLPPHPHLVRFVSGRADRSSEPGANVYYVVTEHCPRTAKALLEGAMRRREPLAEREILNIFTSAAAAVSHLHAHGVAHRAVGVETVHFGAVDGHAKLGDLGSCSTDHRRFRNGAEAGPAREDIDRATPLASRAPEQVDLYSGKVVGEKVDVWALGVLLYRLCWWRTPFEDAAGSVSSMAILSARYKAPPPPLGATGLPPYSPGIVALLRCLLEPDPDLRPTAAEVLDRVRDLMAAGELSFFSDLPALSPAAEASAAASAPPPSALPLGNAPPPIPGGLPPRRVSPAPSTATSASPSPPHARASENEEDLLGLGNFETATHLGPPGASASASAAAAAAMAADLSFSASASRGKATGGGGGTLPPPIVCTPRDGGTWPRAGSGVMDLSASSSLAPSTSGTGMGGKSLSFARLPAGAEDGGGGSGGEDEEGDGARAAAAAWRGDGSGLDWTMGAGDLAVTAASSTRRRSSGGGSGIDISEMATVNRALPRSSSSSSLSGLYDEQGRPKNPKKALGLLWQRRMRYLMGGGGEKGKRSWVVKATSKEAGQPKAKYVRKIVLAVWDRGMSSSTFFIYLYQRPVTAHPVVALKGLITTLKLLQQGPKDFLAECVPCLGLLDEIGRHWGAILGKVATDPSREQLTRSATAEGYTSVVQQHGSGGSASGAASPSHKRQHLDAASIDLLARMARLLVQKLHFHEQHPAFATHFTAIPTMLGYETVPLTGGEEDVRALSRLLTLQESIIQASRLVFAAQNNSVAATARWALLPLVEEAYTVLVAVTFLLASLLELNARASAGLPPIPVARGGGGGGKQGKQGRQQPAPAPIDWRQRVTVLLALREQYEQQLASLRAFYASAERVEEVRAMKRMPTLPASVPVALDGALNWKPATMRSPMQGLGLLNLDRARMQEEEHTGSTGSGSGASQQGQQQGRVTASSLAQLEADLPLSSSSGRSAGSSSLGSARPAFAPVPAPQPPLASVRLPPPAPVVAPPPAASFSAGWEAFSDTAGFSRPGPGPGPGAGAGGAGGAAAGGSPVYFSATQMPPAPSPPLPAQPPPPALALSNIPASLSSTAQILPSQVGAVATPGRAAAPAPAPASTAGSVSPSGPLLASQQGQQQGQQQFPPPTTPGRIPAGEEGDDWFLPSTVHEAPGLGLSVGRSNTAALLVSDTGTGGSDAGVRARRSSTVEDFLSTTARLDETVVVPVVHSTTSAAAAPGGGSTGAGGAALPPRMSIAGVPVGSGGAGPGGRDLLEWSSSSSEEDEDEEDDLTGTTGSVAALDTNNMSRLMGIGGGGGATPIIMGASGMLGTVDGAEGEQQQQDGQDAPQPPAPPQPVVNDDEGETKRTEDVGPPPPPQQQQHQQHPGQQPHQQAQPQQGGDAAAAAAAMAAEQQKQLRARRREARAQPWRANMKPAVATALAACLREFEAAGNLIALDDIVWGETIGHGAFATVYRGYCLGQDVAVKKLVTQNGLPMAEKSVRDFASEVSLLRMLRHPNIIGYVGACVDPVAVVTEFCHKGNLFMVLNEKGRYKDISWARKLSVARGLADGMHYLHTRDPILIHRDLKSLNVLLSRDWVVKITDFGLSRFKPHSITDIMTMQCGTYHWMAPEVINSTKYTEKADVYSFGIILWEIYTRAIPYDGMQPVQVVAAVINRVERPPLPPDCPAEYAALVRACWAHDAADRPSFSEIVDWLRTIPQ